MASERQRVDKGAKVSTELLLKEFGLCIGGKDLRHLLGFKNARAFGHAVRRGHLSIDFFNFPGRRGRFALAPDVAEFLNSIAPPSTKGSKSRVIEASGSDDSCKEVPKK